MSDFTPADLPRVAERIPYLYLEQCVIKRMNNALVAADENGETQLPIATIAVLMLGPGTTITHDAVVLAKRHRRRSSYGPESRESATIVAVPHSPAPPDFWNSSQTRIQRESRLMVARRMYAMRFPGEDSVPYDDAPTARHGRHPSRSPVHG